MTKKTLQIWHFYIVSENFAHPCTFMGDVCTKKAWNEIKYMIKILSWEELKRQEIGDQSKMKKGQKGEKRFAAY